MRAPQYNEQMRYQTRNTFQARQGMSGGNVSSMLANNPANRQLGELAQATGKLANAFEKVEQERSNARINEAMNNMNSEFTAWQSEQQKKQGKDALNVSADYDKFKNESLSKFTSELSDYERSKFDMEMQKQIALQTAWSTNYEFNEEQKYLDSNTVASFKNIADSVIAFPQSMGVEMERVDILVNEYAQRKGLSDEAAEAYAREQKTGIYSSVITARINENNLGSAQSVLEKSKGVIDEETYTAFQDTIRTKREINLKKIQDANKKAEAEKQQIAQDNAFTDVISIAGAVENPDDGFAIAIKYIDKNYGEDPEFRAKLLNQVNSEMEYRKIVRNAQALTEYNTYTRETADKSPLEKQAWLAENNISVAGKSKIVEYEQKQSTVETVENVTQKNEILRAIDDRADAKRPMSENELNSLLYDSKLTPTQIADVSDYFRKGGTEGQVTQTQLDKAFKFVYPTKKAAQMPEDFRKFVVSQLPSGREATDYELNQIAARYAMEGTDITKSDDWFGSSLSYKEALEENKLDDWLPEVEDDEKAVIDMQLKSLGYKLNDKNRALYKKEYMLDMGDYLK